MTHKAAVARGKKAAATRKANAWAKSRRREQEVAGLKDQLARLTQEKVDAERYAFRLDNRLTEARRYLDASNSLILYAIHALRSGLPPAAVAVTLNAGMIDAGSVNVVDRVNAQTPVDTEERSS